MQYTITVDISSLPMSGDSYRYVLVVVDLLAIYVEIVSLKHQSTKFLYRAVRAKWIHRHGLPIGIITDQGRNIVCNCS